MPKVAMDKAQAIGRAEAAIDDGVEIDGKPAAYKFAGVRRITNVSNPPPLDLDRDSP
jgi:hypothetical protein